MIGSIVTFVVGSIASRVGSLGKRDVHSL